MRTRSTNAGLDETAFVGLAAALAAISVDAIGEAVAERARQRLFDTLGATRLGLATAEAASLARWGRRLDALGGLDLGPGRCGFYAAAARTTEVDDIDIESCTTVGAVVVPVALGVAATAGSRLHRGAQPELDGRALLAGVIAGYEAMIRLGRAIDGASALYRGVWPTYVTAPFAAAATTARILELDAEHTARALALALARSNGLALGDLARFGFRYYALACAVREGCSAALAAAADVDADIAGIGSFCERVGARFDAAELLDGLGREWRIGDVDTKMLPSSRQALASVEAFTRQAPLAHPIRDLASVEVYVPRQFRDMVDRPTPPSQRIESMIGVQYAIALAALQPDALYDVLRRSPQESAAIEALMGQISVHADENLSARFPRVWGSKVTVRWTSGEQTTTEVLTPAGSGRSDLDWRALERKHARLFLASRMPSAAPLARLLTLCRSVGNARDEDAALELLRLLESSEAWGVPPETAAGAVD